MAHQRQRRIQTMKVVHVAGHDDRALSPCGQNDRRVDDVLGAQSATKNPRSLRKRSIERGNRRGGTVEKRAERHLASATPPNLTCT